MTLKTLFPFIDIYQKFELCEQVTWNIDGKKLVGSESLTHYNDMVNEFKEKHLKKYGNRKVINIQSYSGDLGIRVIVEGVKE